MVQPRQARCRHDRQSDGTKGGKQQQPVRRRRGATGVQRAGPMTPLISLRGLTRRFVTGAETLTVLDDVNLDIEAGEMIAIVRCARVRASRR